MHRCGGCLAGYQGNQQDGCIPALCQACSVNASCLRLASGLYNCACNYGWAGDGILCGSDSDFDGFPDIQLECKVRYFLCYLNIST